MFIYNSAEFKIQKAHSESKHKLYCHCCLLALFNSFVFLMLAYDVGCDSVCCKKTDSGQKLHRNLKCIIILWHNFTFHTFTNQKLMGLKNNHIFNVSKTMVIQRQPKQYVKKRSFYTFTKTMFNFQKCQNCTLLSSLRCLRFF